MKTYKLHLLRHGLTQANLDGIYIGSGTDLPLCEQGKRQLDALCERFAYPPVSLVFTSPLLRATQTAEILFPQAKKIIVDDLREMAFGEFENRPMKELVKDPAFGEWLNPQSHTVPRGGEDRVTFYRRSGEVLMKMFEYLIKAGVTEAACVTHGGVLMNMLAQHAIPQHKPEEWMADPGCGYTVRCSVEMWMRDKIVEAVDVVPEGYLDEEE